jgi:hypothetical protein
MATHKRRFGDRNDGRLLRTLDPFYKIIPYIMRTRIDSQTYYDDKIVGDSASPATVTMLINGDPFILPGETKPATWTVEFEAVEE